MTIIIIWSLTITAHRMSTSAIQCYLLAALMVSTWGKGPTATVCKPLLYRVKALSVNTNDARLGGYTYN